MKIAITGADGFIGKNLQIHLRFKGYTDLAVIGRTDDRASIVEKLRGADFIFHLAGANRPQDPKEFETVNVDLTTFLVSTLEGFNRPYKLIYTSSSQAALANPYGESKLNAEYSIERGIRNGTAFIYRLPGVFGKWCKPNYNSVVATFCYSIARNLPVQISDPANKLRVVYIDDVIRDFVACLDRTGTEPGKTYRPEVGPVHETTLGDLAALLKQFMESRSSLILPEIGDPFVKKLYTTWLSYLPEDAFSYGLELKTDNRGWLFELLKTRGAGQIFISKTHPGITRGNHFHHTKTEKFLVIQGEGLIRFRKVTGEAEEVIEYRVSGAQPQVVDIPPGYTHNITNVGNDEMLTLFWANEIFDAANPDTYFLNV